MEKKVHPITGFSYLQERDKRDMRDIIIEPLKSSSIRSFVGIEHNMSEYWFEALRDA